MIPPDLYPCRDCGSPIGVPLIPRDDPTAELCPACLIARHYSAEAAAARRWRDGCDALVGLVVALIIVGCLWSANR